MKALLICPASREGVQLLCETGPLSNLPLLGQTLLEYWLSYLSVAGIREVLILASDRPKSASSVVGDGARWGLTVEVVSETRELTASQALLKYDAALSPGSIQNGVVVLDHFPGRTQCLFTSYNDLVAEAIGWIPSACGPDRVGCRELEPGVWVSYHAHVDKGARLRGPCWIGKRTFIGDGAVIGPCAVVEDRCFVEKGVEIRDSILGPHTFVGRHAEIANSIAVGDTLIHRKTGSAARVPDPFVLCSLRRNASSGGEQGWLARMSELVARNKSDVQLIWKHFLMNKEG